MFIYGLNSHLKCSFKSILENKTPKCFPAGPSFGVSYMERLSKCPYLKKPQIIPSCAPELLLVEL